MIVKKIKLFVIFSLVLSLVGSCNRIEEENEEDSLEAIRDSYFEVKGIDYLKYGRQNYVHYRYFNPEFKEYVINKDRIGYANTTRKRSSCNSKGHVKKC